MNVLESRRKDGREEDEDGGSELPIKGRNPETARRPFSPNLVWLNLGNPLSAKSLFSGNVTPVEVKRLRRFLPQPNLWLAT